MNDLEAVQYQVPHWECPNCDFVNDGFGQDDLKGPQTCVECATEVTVTD